VVIDNKSSLQAFASDIEIQQVHPVSVEFVLRTTHTAKNYAGTHHNIVYRTQTQTVLLKFT